MNQYKVGQRVRVWGAYESSTTVNKLEDIEKLCVALNGDRCEVVEDTGPDGLTRVRAADRIILVHSRQIEPTKEIWMSPVELKERVYQTFVSYEPREGWIRMSEV